MRQPLVALCSLAGIVALKDLLLSGGLVLFVTGSLVSRSGRDWVIPFPGSPLIRGTLLGNCFALNDLWLFERRHHLRQHLRPHPRASKTVEAFI